MLRWLSSDKRNQETQDVFQDVTTGLQQTYRTKLKGHEKDFFFHQFYSPELTDADFSARPMVMLMGQYSTGKSTFIRHLLERDYPGIRIGPEPTTDKFCCVTYAEEDQVIPGNAMVVDPTMPFQQLGNFGNNFLNRLECSKLSSKVLQGCTFIDTPGILSGEQQRLQRGYDFEGVIKWFADRVDMVVLLFDAHKLDISDEFKRCIKKLVGNDNKVRIVLNKCDRVTTQQLMRVYGALMWSLGKVLQTPEVARVYLGSFWDEVLQIDEQRRLFEMEENDLYRDIALLPKNAAMRKVNDLIKRARLCKTHCYLLMYIRAQMPSMFGKDKKKREIINNLSEVYRKVGQEYNLPLGDFPAPHLMRERLEQLDLSKIPKPRDLSDIDRMLAADVPRLLQLLQLEKEQEDIAPMPFIGQDPSPFASMGNAQRSMHQGEKMFADWVSSFRESDYAEAFAEVGPNETARLTGSQLKNKLEESRLPSHVLHKIWAACDRDRMGQLTCLQFAMAMHLIKMRLDGHDLPEDAPAEWVAR